MTLIAWTKPCFSSAKASCGTLAMILSRYTSKHENKPLVGIRALNSWVSQALREMLELGTISGVGVSD